MQDNEGRDPRRHDLRGEGHWSDDDFTTWEESLSWERHDERASRRAAGTPEPAPPQEAPGETASRRPRRPPRLLRPAAARRQAPADETGARPVAAPPGAPPRHRRRRASAGATLLAMLLGFFFAGLLDAGGIRKDIEGRPLGTMRSVQLALLSPMVALSSALSFDAPANALDAALGRGDKPRRTLADVPAEATAKWPRTITRAEPLRLLVVGDSMALDLGPYVKNSAEQLKTFKARVSYKVSSGLSRPDFFDWPQYMLELLVDYDPDATVVVFGVNDAQDFRSKGKVVVFGTPEWDAAYAARVARAMKILTRDGRRVYWLGTPVMREPVFSKAMARVNGLYEAEAKKHPGVHYLSTWDLLAGPDGGYAQYLDDAKGRPILMRASDGQHFSMAGADLVASYALDVVKQDWSMTTPAASPQASPSPSP